MIPPLTWWVDLLFVHRKFTDFDAVFIRLRIGFSGSFARGCILSMSPSWLPSPTPVSRESRIVKSEKSDRCHAHATYPTRVGEDVLGIKF